MRTGDLVASLQDHEKNVDKKIEWRSSLIIFIYVIRVLLYGASKAENHLTAWGEIFKTILDKNAPDIFRKKSFMF
jgi:hypothetical protein